MKRPLQSTLFFLLAILGFTLHVYGAKTNVILIMADDFGYECLSANGGQSYQTPNLDRLAANGVRFEHCHVQPLCTPTRVQLMTGKFNIRNYINFGTLPRTESTFAHSFQRAGYATAVCGKWQLGREKDSPQHFGFEESCLWQQTRRPPRYANPGLEYNGVEKDFSDGEYGPKLVNDFALDFISRNRERPFFLYYPMILTHDPFQPTPDSPDWDPTTKGENAKRSPKHFADMTVYMDKLVGLVEAKLIELKIRDNTLILFVGDNGTNVNLTSRFQGSDYKGGKGTTTARGTHVPLFVSWPAAIKTGTVNRDLISSVDIFPTLCEAAGIAVPENIDGTSFEQQLHGKPGKPREWLYCWYSPRQQADLRVKEYVQDHRYKLYRTGELYELANDLNEKSPLKPETLSKEAKQASTNLQKVLDQFANARPQELDRLIGSANGTSDKE